MHASRTFACAVSNWIYLICAGSLVAPVAIRAAPRAIGESAPAQRGSFLQSSHAVALHPRSSLGSEAAMNWIKSGLSEFRDQLAEDTKALREEWQDDGQRGGSLACESRASG